MDIRTKAWLTFAGAIIIMFFDGSFYVWFDLSPYAVSYLYYIDHN